MELNRSNNLPFLNARSRKKLKQTSNDFQSMSYYSGKEISYFTRGTKPV